MAFTSAGPPQTVRVSNLPAGTTRESVKTWFETYLRRDGFLVQNPGFPCGHAGQPYMRCAVTLTSENGAKAALALSGKKFWLNSRECASAVVDSNFLGLTTVYQSAHMPNLDIVVIHGLNGHAWNSWTKHENGEEINWVRDHLPKILEDKGIFPRIMIYGYNANVFVHRAVVDVTVPSTNLVIELQSEREDCAERPLAFIAHSLGGIVAKQTICELINVLINDGASQCNRPVVNPVKACLFFGVPHEGSASATTFYPFLKLLPGPSPKLVKDLRPQSDTLPDIQARFLAFRNEFSIEVMSCWEQLPYNNKSLIVSRASAVLDYPNRPMDYSIHANHVEMVRFAHTSQAGFMAIVNAFGSLLTKAINSPVTLSMSSLSLVDADLPSPPQGPTVDTLDVDLLTPWKPPNLGPNGEDAYTTLHDYDTLLLVDDSGSMAGSQWNMTAKVLAQLARRAVYYDRDGVDIHFFNATDKNRNNVLSTRDVMQLFDEIRPAGRTPTYSRLQGRLKSYLDRYDKDPSIKKSNIIVITDGAPDEDVEHIKKLIVKVAKRLDGALADVHQIGIQFVQIGTDVGATRFFRYIDDEIQKAENLDRDMIDTVRFDPNTADESVFKKILLGAIHDDWDHKPVSSADSSSQASNGPTPLPPPMHELRTSYTLRDA